MILSILSLIITGGTLIYGMWFFSSIECVAGKENYTALLIAALAAITTVLIGWQIFSIADFRHSENKFESRVKESIIEMDRKKTESIEDNARFAMLSNSQLADRFLESATGISPSQSDAFVNFIDSEIAVMFHASLCKNFHNAEIVSKYVIEKISKNKIPITPQNMANLISALSHVSHPEEIPSIHELRNAIQAMPLTTSKQIKQKPRH